MVSELAGGGHLAVESRDGTLFYSLPGRRSAELEERWGRFAKRHYRPVNLASRFSKNAVTPSLWSCVKPQNL